MTVVNDSARNQLYELLERRTDVAVWPPTALEDATPPRRSFLYRPGELLIGADYLEKFDVVAGDLGLEIASTDPDPEGGPIRVRLGFTPEDFEEMLVAIDQTGAWGGLDVTPNHVLLRCGGGWMFEVPHPPSPGEPDADDVNAKADVAVIDDETHGAAVTKAVRDAAPGARLAIGAVLDDDGIIDELQLRQEYLRALDYDPAVINLSIGGVTRKDRPLLGLKDLPGFKPSDKRPIVVAAAGNDGVIRPFQPAAMPAVVAVGTAVKGADGGWTAASNHGDWVNAWVDTTGGDPSTSFAAPKVAGRIAQLLVEGTATEPRRAWRAVLKDAEKSEELGPIVS